MVNLLIYTKYSSNKLSIGVGNVIDEGGKVLKEVVLTGDHYKSNDDIVLRILFDVLDDIVLPLEIITYNINKRTWDKEYKQKNLKKLHTKVKYLEYIRDSKLEDASEELRYQEKNKKIEKEIKKFTKRVESLKQAKGIVKKKHYISVSYESKDEAKRLGAKWDNTMQQWYISDDDFLKRKGAFRKWL